tara:strand:- start:1759 stop:1986 length:228 start_codon:yes stop_codon:yes gene_type:complete
MKSKSQLLYEALEKHYQAQAAEAVATLDIYFNDSVGIGEHPQQIEEMQKQVEKLASAEDSLVSLEHNFSNKYKYK